MYKRQELGLAYDVYAHPSSYYLCGAYNIYTGVNPKRAKDALAAILEQIDLARKKGIAREEFSRGKNQLRGNYILGLESTTSRMNAIGKSITPVSYTHLDVYKRQRHHLGSGACHPL